MANKTKEYKLDVVKVKLVKEAPLYADKKISCSDDVIEFMQEELKGFDREAFCILNLKTDGSVINMNIVSIGTLNASLVEPREIFKCCILSNAAAFIAFHNHPSGNITPSQEDIRTTKRLEEAGKLLNIRLVDHIIVGAGTNESYSFKANDMLSVDEKRTSYSVEKSVQSKREHSNNKSRQTRDYER